MINHSFKVGDINSSQLAYPRHLTLCCAQGRDGNSASLGGTRVENFTLFKRVARIWTRCLEIIFVSPVQQLLNIQSYSVLPVFRACWQRTRTGAGNRMFNGNQKAKAREDKKPNRMNANEIKGLHCSRNCIKCALARVLKTTPAAIPDQGWSAGPRLFQYCIYIVLFPLSSNYRKQINQGTTQVNLFTLTPGLSLNEIKWYWWYS